QINSDQAERQATVESGVQPSPLRRIQCDEPQAWGKLIPDFGAIIDDDEIDVIAACRQAIRKLHRATLGAASRKPVHENGDMPRATDRMRRSKSAVQI